MGRFLVFKDFHIPVSASEQSGSQFHLPANAHTNTDMSRRRSSLELLAVAKMLYDINMSVSLGLEHLNSDKEETPTSLPSLSAVPPIERGAGYLLNSFLETPVTGTYREL